MSKEPQYINPYTDFGFKKLFGEEANKDLLIDFLNQLLPQNYQINELFFRNVENISDSPLDRKAVFDIHCISVKGERFIVEMQKAKIKHFKERSLFYTTFPIKEQAIRGNWNFQLEPIFYIAILDFLYDVEKEKAKVKRLIQLKDQDCELFYDKLHFVFIQMPAFTKQKHQLNSRYDKWLYFLKNLESFESIPDILSESVFQKAFQTAKIANFSPSEYQAYQHSLLYYRDMLQVMNTKYEEGMEKGIEKITVRCLKSGKNLEEIAAITALNHEQINKIKEKYDL